MSPMPDHSVSSSCTGHEIVSPRMNARFPCDDRMTPACPGVCPGVPMTLIPGAITSETFEANPQDYEGKTIITYCTVGGRSGMYASQLQARGFNAVNFKGSILAWTHAGGELESPQGPTTKVHTYSKKFNLAAEGYEPVW